MRTWKQGVVGAVDMPESETLYVKCLKYPLAVFYGSYDVGTRVLGKELFKAFLRLDTLRHIGRIGSANLTPDEKKLGNLFEVRHDPGTTVVKEIVVSGRSTGLTVLHGGAPCSISDLGNRPAVDA